MESAPCKLVLISPRVRCEFVQAFRTKVALFFIIPLSIISNLQIYIVNLSRKTSFAICKTFFLSDLSGTLFSKFWLFFYSKHEQDLEGKYILLRYHPFTELVFYAASIVLQSATFDEEIIVL